MPKCLLPKCIAPIQLFADSSGSALSLIKSEAGVLRASSKVEIVICHSVWRKALHYLGTDARTIAPPCKLAMTFKPLRMGGSIYYTILFLSNLRK